MKTTPAGRALFAALVCCSAQVSIQHSPAQGNKIQPKPKPAAVPGSAIPSGPPGVEIAVPKVALGTGEDVEVRFSAPMVADAMTGKAVPASSVLDIVPALDARLVWHSSRTATLQLESEVSLGAVYNISLRRGLKDAAGKPVNPGPPVTASGPAFLVEQHQPRWFNTTGADARQPAITIYCNDEVNPAAVAKASLFRDKAGRSVPATAVAVAVSELGRYPVPFGRHGERYGEREDGKPPTLPPGDASALSVVKITPASLLPPGEDWKLIVGRDLSNASNAARTPAAYIINYGTIPLMEVAGVEAEPVLDAARQLHVTFTKSVAELKPAEWSRYITVEPKPAGLVYESSGRRVTMKGGFEHRAAYTVKVQAGTPALDQTSLGGALEKKVQFQAHEPHLSLPSFDAAQWLGGKGAFTFTAANVAKTGVQVKRIAPDRAVDALRAYSVYQHDPSREDSSEYTRIPYAAVSGKTVWEKEFPSAVELDHSERFNFTWDETGGKRAMSLYIDGIVAATGTGPANSGSDKFSLGASNHLQGKPFIGSFDEIRIYNRTLSVADIAALAQRNAK